jgi:TolA-binding protein
MVRFGKLILIGCLSIAPASVMGDSIWLGISAKNPILATDVHIVRIQADFLVYTNPGGSEVSKPLDQVQQMNADGENDFNAAEQAYRDGKLANAANSYQKTIRTTSKDWVRDRSSIRLAELSAKLNRFDTAATAYVGLILKDPATAAAAKPVISDAVAPYYDGALGDIKHALETNKLADTQQGALLGFALELYRAKKNSAAANQTVAELIKLGLANPSDIAMVKIGSARVALDAKDYAKATAEIQQNRALFNEPAQQADALYILAQAKDAIDGSKDSSEIQKDLAIAYMRVVTVGKDAPGQPHVADALMRVAQIEEKLKELTVATKLYQQISKDYSGQPIAGQAKTSLDRLAGKGN